MRLGGTGRRSGHPAYVWRARVKQRGGDKRTRAVWRDRATLDCMGLLRRQSRDERLHEGFSKAYRAEATRMLDLLGRDGTPMDVRRVAMVHRNAVQHGTQAVDRSRRMSMTPQGVACLRRYESSNLAALLKHTGVSMDDYARHAWTEHERKWRAEHGGD